MGFHFAKQELLDAKTQAQKPEVLVYMPNDYGRYKLVAAEFISTAAQRPSIAGLKFEDGTFPQFVRASRVGVEGQPGRHVRSL